jgi:hypothetical protein
MKTYPAKFVCAVCHSWVVFEGQMPVTKCDCILEEEILARSQDESDFRELITSNDSIESLEPK